MKKSFKFLKNNLLKKDFNFKENLKKAYQQFQDYRILPNLVRIKIQGELNQNLQNQFLYQINKAQKWKPDLLLIVINSLGGSLQTAKNISYRIKKITTDKKIPVHCFAQQYCLNSANIILTAGEKCYAHKFSILGEFGYVHNRIDTTELKDKLNIKEKLITSNTSFEKYQINPLNQTIIPTNEDLIRKVLAESEKILIEQVLKNRISRVERLRNERQKERLTEQIRGIGQIDPTKCVENGVIDGIIGVEQYIIENHAKKKVIDISDKYINETTLRWLRKIRQTLAQHD